MSRACWENVRGNWECVREPGVIMLKGGHAAKKKKKKSDIQQT